MADQGLWWKLWCSALDDPGLDNLPIGDFGRYCKLGAFMKRHGVGGTVTIDPPARALCASFQVPDFSALLSVVSRLPNVVTRRTDTECFTGVSSETSATVTFANWQKYQGDYSTMRVRNFRARETEMKRAKRRREEKRGEEKRREEKTPSPSPPVSPPSADLIEFKVNDEIKAALKQAPRLGAIPRLWSVEFWRAEIRANGAADMPTEILKAEAWMAANPHKAPRKDLARFLHNWLSRADRDVED
jgi:hypothetical protein